MSDSAGAVPGQPPTAGEDRHGHGDGGGDGNRHSDADRDEYGFGDLSVVMGTYNEEAAVGTVIDDIHAVTDSRAEIVCVDGSTDQTAAIARDRGARVIEQAPQGYGVAVERALRAADRPVVVTTDCDETYPMARLPRFLRLVNAGYDVVSGDRLYHGADAMPAANRLGNHLFAALASALLGTRVHDVTTGMRAYRREVIESIGWSENTGLSAELLMRPLLRGYDVTECPIRYGSRRGASTLDPLRGGAAIAKSILTVGLAERLR